jgi:micrococcal nuclease
LLCAAFLAARRSPSRSAADAGAAPGPPQDLAAEERLCVRVVDGDTIVLEGRERVRYIGIDTPETKHPKKPVERMGEEAAAANRRLVEGKRVRLERDVQALDRYGRTLAYVWVGDVMVNERLVRAGYAQVATYPPNVKHAERLVAAQQEAREARRGLWGDGAEPARDPMLDLSPVLEQVFLGADGRVYHRAWCPGLGANPTGCPRGDAVARGSAPCDRCRP